MADDLTFDGLPEREFRNEIEMLLRMGNADEAASRLGRLIASWCGPGRPLPARFLTVQPRDIKIDGWNDLPDRIRENDKYRNKATAISIDFSWPGHIRREPDANGHMDPLIETSYYSDECFPFSTSDRAGLLAGYAKGGCEWQGCFEDLDNTISMVGISDLYGSLQMLDGASNSIMERKQAWVVGMCYIAVLGHLAVRDFVPRSILPRTMAVIVGSNEEYPYFNAPAFAAR